MESPFCTERARAYGPCCNNPWPYFCPIYFYLKHPPRLRLRTSVQDNVSLHSLQVRMVVYRLMQRAVVFCRRIQHTSLLPASKLCPHLGPNGYCQRGTSNSKVLTSLDPFSFLVLCSLQFHTHHIHTRTLPYPHS